MLSMIIENIPTLKMHKLTQEQYNRERYAGNIKDDEIYLTPIEELGVRDISDDFIVASSEHFSAINIMVKQYGNVITGYITAQINYEFSDDEELYCLINDKYTASHQVYCPIFWEDGQTSNYYFTINNNDIKLNPINTVSGVAQFSFCYICK